MKTNQVIFTAAFAAALLGTAALAQNTAPAPASPPANEIVYVPQLPSPADLTSAASAQGMSVVKIDQTSDDVTVTYKSSAGQMSVVSYKPISAVEAGAIGAAPAAGTAVAPATATTTVVYGPPASPYYYPYGYGYYPYGWYPPVALRLGFGFGFRGGRWR